MITEQALQEAIAECQGERNPNRDTCMMLAAFYIIQDRLYPQHSEPEPQAYSYAQPPDPKVEEVTYQSDSEFGQAINGKAINDVLPVIDEAMDVIKVMLPRLYAGILRKLEE